MAESLSAETHDAVAAEVVGTKRQTNAYAANQAVMPPSFLFAARPPRMSLSQYRRAIVGVGRTASGRVVPVGTTRNSAVQRPQYALIA